MAKIIGELVFDIDRKSIKTTALFDSEFVKIENNITNIFAKGTNDIIGAMSWTFTDTILNGYENINGNYIIYLPEGNLSLFLGSRYLIDKRPIDYPLPINGGTGNFLNSIGNATTKINSDKTITVTVLFYDKAVYPLV